MKKIHPKMNALEWSIHFSHYKFLGIFPEAQGQLTLVPGQILPNFEPIQDVMVVFITCKNKEEPIKNEGARLVTRFSLWKPEFSSDLAQNLMQPISHPNDAQDEI